MIQKNRWLIALSAIAIHLSIGSAYAYSVFKKPLTHMWGWSTTETTMSFTIAIFFLGASAAVFGRLVEKHGPRKSALTAAVLFSSGMFLSGLAAAKGSLIGFYLGYGVIGGMGLGIGYISPVSTLVKWFPDRRGLATGMAVLGFGAGSLITAPIAAYLIKQVGVPTTFYILATAYLVLMTAGASYIAKPSEGWLPKGMQAGGASGKAVKVRQDLAQMTVNQAVRTPRFWMLWLMMLINISSGIMLISVASPIAQEKVGMTEIAAGAMVGLMGLFNGGGRIGWASLSDYVGRTNVFTIFFGVQAIAFLILPHVTSILVFQLLVFAIMTMYGGGFATLPAFIGDMFGTKQLGAIHGCLLTSWSLAAIVGPMVAARVEDMTGSYDLAFYVFAPLLLIALVTSLAIRANIRRVQEANLRAARQATLQPERERELEPAR